MSGAARLRRHRDRLAHGQVVVSAAFDEDELLDVLVRGGLLDPLQADKPRAVAAALKRQVEVLHWLARRNHPMLPMLALLALDDD